jgi:hypothetical protein
MLVYENIIVIIGMPRSGTSWLGQIVDSCPDVRYRLSPLFSYAFKNAVDEDSSREDYEKVFHGAYLSNDEFMCQTQRRASGHYPLFELKVAKPQFLAIKMTRFHNLISNMINFVDNLKMVAIVRHPCGAINSWLTTPGEFPKDADPMKEWRYGHCRKTGREEFWGFEDWKKVTRLHMSFERQFPNRFIIQRYEFLVENFVEETKKLFDFLELKYTQQTDNFLKSSHSKHDDDSYAVFKDPKVKDRWKWKLNEQIQKEIIREVEHTELRRFLE